jgi:hypothetical protein
MSAALLKAIWNRSPVPVRYRADRCDGSPISLTLNAQSNTVISVTRAITRYGITTDAPNKWRYYLDSVEVHLPPFWEQYINDENSVELIRTDTLPLVISLNGHALNEYRPEEHSLMPEQVSSSHSAIRGEETEQIELLNIRQETVEEYALSRPDGMREALLISTSFLLFFFCLVTPDVFVPGLPVAGSCCLRPGSGASLRRLRKTRCAKSTACAARPNAGAFW